MPDINTSMMIVAYMLDLYPWYIYFHIHDIISLPMENLVRGLDLGILRALRIARAVRLARLARLVPWFRTSIQRLVGYGQ